MIDKIFEGQKKLFYVDLAANHYLSISNTYALDRHRDWDGICVEANPKYWYDLMTHRSCKVFGAAVTSAHDSHLLVNFTFDPEGPHPDRGAMGGLLGAQFDNKNARGGSAFLVPSIGFAELLHIADAPKEIEYLSLDIEGAEEYVMTNFDFTQYTFKTMTIERPTRKLSEFLRSKDYIFVTSLAFFDDELWVHKSMRDSVPGIDRLLKQRTRQCGVK